MLLALLGALAIGLSLGLLGSGGSILTVPVLHYLVGQPEKLAIGGSLLVVGLIAASASVPYALHRQVDWRNVAWFGLPGMLGAWVGATLARWVPGPVQLAAFALVMLVAAWRMLRGGVTGRGDDEPHRMAVVAGGFGVGALSGLVGIGGGFLIVPALVLLAGVPMASAVGTSLAVIALNAFAGFAKYLGVLASQSLEKIRADIPAGAVVFGDDQTCTLLAMKNSNRLAGNIVDTNDMRFTSGISDIGTVLDEVSDSGLDYLVLRPAYGIGRLAEMRQYAQDKCRQIDHFFDEYYADFFVYKCR